MTSRSENRDGSDLSRFLTDGHQSAGGWPPPSHRLRFCTGLGGRRWDGAKASSVYGLDSSTRNMNPSSEIPPPVVMLNAAHSIFLQFTLFIILVSSMFVVPALLESTTFTH